MIVHQVLTGDAFKIENYLSESDDKIASYYEEGKKENTKIYELTRSDVISAYVAGSDTKTKLLALSGRKRVGIDFTLSFSKDVSVLAFVGDRNLKRIISDEAPCLLCEMIDDRVYTRAQKGGKRENVKAKGFYQVFAHKSTREGDPSLHFHTLLSNNVEFDGKFLSLSAEKIINEKYYMNAVLNYKLANKLQDEGYQAFFDKNLNLKMIKDNRIDKIFSKRLKEMREYSLERFGIKLEDLSDDQYREVFYKTRKHKAKDPAPEIRWQAELEAEGLDIETLKALAKGGSYAGELDKQGIEKSYEIALHRLSEQKGFFRDVDLEVEFLKEISKACDEKHLKLPQYERVKRFFEQKRVSDDIVTIKRTLPGTTIEEVILVERSYLEMERAALQRAERMGMTPRPVASQEEVAEAIAAFEASAGVRLTKEQRAAVETCTGGAQLVVVQGVAGAGKTTSAAITASVYRERGYQIMALAPTGKAAAEIGASLKADAATIDAFLANPPQEVSKKTLFFIDEAGMVDTRRLAPVLAMAERAGAHVILQGDHRQLKPIGAGDLFTDIYHTLKEKRAKPRNIAEIKTIRRQKTELYRELAVSYSEKNLKRSLKAFANGFDKFFRNFDEEKLKDWILKDPFASIIVATDNSARKKLNLEIRDELKRKEVIKDSQTFKVFEKIDLSEAKPGDIMVSGKARYEIKSIENGVFLAEKMSNKRKKEILRISRQDLELKNEEFSIERLETRDFGVGDRLIITKNDRKRGIKNGDLFQIVDINSRSIVIENNGKIVRIPHDFGYLDHAYAITTHKSQGMTIDRVAIADGGRSNFNLSYVGISRGKKELKIFTPDPVNFIYRSQIENRKITSKNVLESDIFVPEISRNEIAQTLAKAIIKSDISIEAKKRTLKAIGKYIDDTRVYKALIEEIEKKGNKNKDINGPHELQTISGEIRSDPPPLPARLWKRVSEGLKQWISPSKPAKTIKKTFAPTTTPAKTAQRAPQRPSRPSDDHQKLKITSRLSQTLQEAAKAAQSPRQTTLFIPDPVLNPPQPSFRPSETTSPAPRPGLGIERKMRKPSRTTTTAERGNGKEGRTGKASGFRIGRFLLLPFSTEGEDLARVLAREMEQQTRLARAQGTKPMKREQEGEALERLIEQQRLVEGAQRQDEDGYQPPHPRPR